MTAAERRRQLYDALRQTGFNQVRAAKLMGVSRETVRQRLIAVGGIPALIAWAVECGLATKDDSVALAALAALASANPGNANQGNDGQAVSSANSSEIRHLRRGHALPILAGVMSGVQTASLQSSTVRVDGDDREFMKRGALEVALQLGLPREDMSGVASRMLAFFRRHGGDPAAVAKMLIEAHESSEVAE
jgi:hypothetical protein